MVCTACPSESRFVPLDLETERSTLVWGTSLRLEWFGDLDAVLAGAGEAGSY